MSSFLSLTPAADDYGVGGREGRGEERGREGRVWDEEEWGGCGEGMTNDID